MLQPKRVKHRKMHRGHRRGMALTGNEVTFGEFGIQSLEPGWITARQIEAARRTITNHLKRGGKVFIRIFPDHWVAVVRPGRVMFEIAGVREDLAKEALRLAGHKLPVGTKFVIKEEVGVHEGV